MSSALLIGQNRFLSNICVMVSFITEKKNVKELTFFNIFSF